jgi:glyoxylase-like metal-dependent hydrolase (beta-lactamase superfamily II)
LITGTAVITELKDKYKTLLDAKKAYEKRLADSLKPRDEPLKDNFFWVLRRWNSYTPRMLTPTESNVGGGYFLHWKGKGIVIDPGFDFVNNFFNEGLVIDDVDSVIITHAHVDHCNDFESLLTLLFEYN